MKLDWNPGEARVAGEEYAAYAPVYDLLFQDMDEDARYYLACAAAAGTGPLLELGVGTGRLALRLLEAGHELVGIDASAPMLEKAKVRLLPHGKRCAASCRRTCAAWIWGGAFPWPWQPTA